MNALHTRARKFVEEQEQKRVMLQTIPVEKCFRMQLPDGNNGKLLQIAAAAGAQRQSYNVHCWLGRLCALEDGTKWEHFEKEELKKEIEFAFQKRNERKSQ